MRKLLTLVFGLFVAVATLSSTTRPGSAAPFAPIAAEALQAAQPLKAEKAYYHGYGHRRFYGGYGYRPYGFYRPYGYYRPRFYGRRCFWRSRVFFNGYRYVRRPVRVCR